MTDTAIKITLHDRIAEIGARDWDGCACPEAAGGGRPEDPFTTYRFLSALEESGSVGRGTGWQPQYMRAEAGGERRAAGASVGARATEAVGDMAGARASRAATGRGAGGCAKNFFF